MLLTYKGPFGRAIGTLKMALTTIHRITVGALLSNDLLFSFGPLKLLCNPSKEKI